MTPNFTRPTEAGRDVSGPQFLEAGGKTQRITQASHLLCQSRDVTPRAEGTWQSRNRVSEALVLSEKFEGMPKFSAVKGSNFLMRFF
jgi:hypothetical protein